MNAIPLCPRCNIYLSVKTHRGHEAFECRRCMGLWAPGEEAEALFPPGDPAHPHSPSDARLALRCASCPGNHRMEPIHLSGAPDLFLDRCDRCGGLWVDQFEVPALERALGLEATEAPRGTPRGRGGSLRDRRAAAGARPDFERIDWEDKVYGPEFWANLPRIAATPLSPMRLVGIAIFATFISLATMIPIIGRVVAAGLILFFMLQALLQGSRGSNRLLDISDYQGAFDSILKPLARYLLGLIPVLGPPTALLLVNDGLAAQLVGLGWIVLTMPMMLMVLALVDGFLAPLWPPLYLRILTGAPLGRLAATAVLFAAVNGLGSWLASLILRLVPVEHFILRPLGATWVLCVLGVMGFQLLGVFVYCHWNCLAP